MSRPESRKEAVNWASSERLHLELDEAWRETGIREWLRDTPPAPCRFASFDTRVDMPRLFTGSAATAIARRLDKLGFDRLSEPMSFLVDHRSRLEPGEVERARAWGADLAGRLTRDDAA
ncbi:flavodoxin [Microbacterium sp. SD291]|nr:flavodoxin [Microbacterium sp. SD291]